MSFLPALIVPPHQWGTATRMSFQLKKHVEETVNFWSPFFFFFCLLSLQAENSGYNLQKLINSVHIYTFYLHIHSIYLKPPSFFKYFWKANWENRTQQEIAPMTRTQNIQELLKVTFSHRYAVRKKNPNSEKQLLLCNCHIKNDKVSNVKKLHVKQ